MNQHQAQAIVYFDCGTLRAELPGINGAPRRKIDLIAGEIEHQLRVALMDEEERIKDQERRRVEALQRENIRAVILDQSQATTLGERFIGPDNIGLPSARPLHMAESWARRIWGDSAVTAAWTHAKARPHNTDETSVRTKPKPPIQEFELIDDLNSIL